MRAVVQRVNNATLTVEDDIKGQIDAGLLVYLGIGLEDGEDDIDWLIRKVVGMRIFSDEDGKMNLSVQDIGGSILVVSQFTLFASTKKGNRPSYLNSAKPEQAIPLYNTFVDRLKEVIHTETGIFGADMQITYTNDGPVTILIDTKEKE
jgi:D-tyrosyl-tRNA(Tyr) deacylase